MSEKEIKEPLVEISKMKSPQKFKASISPIRDCPECAVRKCIVCYCCPECGKELDHDL